VYVFVPYVAPTVKGNTITNCSVGLAAAGSGAPVTTVFQDNDVDGAHSAGSTGVYVTTSELGYGATNVNATFTGNQVLNNTNGFLLQDKTCSVSSTQGCNADRDCPTGETCLVGTSVTLNASCNLISGNDTGILTENLSSPANVGFSSCSIVDNGIGADGTAIASGSINATGNWWGCAAGPGGYGCGTVTAGVDASSPAPAPPTCVNCVSDADCNDALVCNGTETCKTVPGSNGICQSGTPLVCSLGAASPQCNEAVCVEPGGCTVQPTTAGAPCNCGTTGCPGDTCDGTGMCLSPTSLNVSYAQLMLTTRLGKTMGSVAVRGVVDDSDTGGDLKTRLLAGTVSLQVQDSGSFNTTVSLTGCQVRGQGIICTKTMTAHFIPMTPRRTPYRYQMAVTSARLGIGSTGYKPLIPPLTVTLHQGAFIRSDDMSSCKVTRLQMSMICRGS